MTVLETVRSWLHDPFGTKREARKHAEIQIELQQLRGQVQQKTRDLSKHPYRTLHKDFRQKAEGADVRVHE